MVFVYLVNTMKDCGINMEDGIESIAYEVDEFISTMITKYKIDPLILGSVCLARLVLINEYVGSGDDFRKLASNIPTREVNKEPMH